MSLLDDVSLMITPNGVAEDVLFGVLPTPTTSNELVTNGDFSTDSDWTKGTGVTIGSGVCTFTSTPSGQSVQQNAVATALPNGSLAKVTFEVLSITEGSFGLYFSSTLVGSKSSIGVFTVYFTKGTETSFYIRALGTTSGTISNVSVKQYTTSDMDFTRATTATRSAYSVDVITNGNFTSDSGWVVTGDAEILDNSSGGRAYVDGSTQTSLVFQDCLTNGVKYHLTFTVSDHNGDTTNSHIINNSGTVIYAITGNGTFETYFTHAVASGNFIFIASDNSAYYIDKVSVKELLIEEVPRNLFTYSEDFSQFPISNRLVITPNNIISPEGTINASKMQQTDGVTTAPNIASSTVSADTYSVSAFAKKGTRSFLAIHFDGTSYFDLQNGTITTTGSGHTASIENFGNDWYRCHITKTISTTKNAAFYFADTNNTLTTADDEGYMYLYGTQLEIGSQATTYIYTEDRLNVPRLDYTGGGCPHILAEPQRINISLQSQTINDATWTKITGGTGSAPVVTANNVVSPDGTQNAEKVVFDLNGGTSSSDFSMVAQSYTQTAATYSLSCYLKGESGGENMFIDFDTQNANTITLTTDWVRYTFTKAVTNTGSKIIRIGVRGGVTSSDNPTVYMWGCQLEVGSYATSYIPTLAATVTRNQDIFTRTGIGDLINSAEGVLFLEVAALSNDLTTRIISLSDGTNTNRIHFFYYSVSNNIGLNYRVGGSTVSDSTFNLTNITDYAKIAYKWKSGDFALWVNGVEVATDSNTTMLSAGTLNKLAFAQGDNVNHFFGKVRNIQIYKTALSDTQLDDLTS